MYCWLHMHGQRSQQTALSSTYRSRAITHIVTWQSMCFNSTLVSITHSYAVLEVSCEQVMVNRLEHPSTPRRETVTDTYMYVSNKCLHITLPCTYTDVQIYNLRTSLRTYTLQTSTHTEHSDPLLKQQSIEFQESY